MKPDTNIIIDESAALYSVTRKQVLSRDRHPLVVCARHDAMRTMRDCGMSFPAIGAVFSRHHTTVMHACRQVEPALVFKSSRAKRGSEPPSV